MTKAIVAAPQTLGADTERMLKSLVASKLFPELRDVAQAAVKLQMGRAMGLSDYSALTGLFVTGNGKLGLSAHTMSLLMKTYSPPYLKGSPKYRMVVTEHTDKNCAIRILEKVEHYTDSGKLTYKWEEAGVSSFSIEDAKKAGLLQGGTKGVWEKYPRNLLFARATSNAAKWYCSDVFAGQQVYLPDEIPGTNVTMDYETLEVVSVDGKAVGGDETKRQLMVVLIAETNTDVEALKKHFNVDDLDDLTTKQIEQAISVMEKKKTATPTSAASGS